MRKLLFVLLTVLCFNSQAVSAESSNRPVEEGFLAMQDGVRLYYTTRGNGPNRIIVPAALFVEKALSPLESPDRTLIFYDMRNRGRSDYVQNPDTITIQQDVEDLEQLRKHFQIDRFSLIGISYLGEMIILYALKYPQHVDRLIQIGPVPLKFGTEYAAGYTMQDTQSVINTEKHKELKDLKNQGYDKKYPRYYCEKQWILFRDLFVGNPAKVELLGDGPCEMPNEWPVHFDRHLEYHFTSVQKLEVSRDDVRKLQQPVLTIHGTKDRNAPYGAGREWAYLLPNGRLFTLPGVAHFATDEAPEIVIPVMDEFLRGKWPSKAEKIKEDPVVSSSK